MDIAQVDAVVTAVMADATFSSNRTKETPFKQKVSGSRSLWKFLGYIQAHKNDLWDANSVAPKLFLAVLPGREFHPMF
jgi:hypothetical protein